MNEAWQNQNARYLGLAVEWLRLRLLRLAAHDATRERQSAPDAPAPARKITAWLRGHRPAAAAVAVLPSAAPEINDEEIERLGEAIESFESESIPPAHLILGRQFGLSRFESQLLILCVAIELDTRIASLCARAHDDPQRCYPTFALAFALFDGPAWEALSPNGPLRYWRLVEINQPGAQPLTTSALRADERIVNFIKGLNTIDERLSGYLQLLPPQTLAPSHQKVAEQIAARWPTGGAQASLPMVQLLGADALSKQSVAAEVAELLGLRLFRLAAATLPSLAADLEALARLWNRETILQPVALYLDADETDCAPNDPLARLLGQLSGIVFIAARETTGTLVRAGVTFEVAKPSTSEQIALWHEALGERVNGFAAQLAAQFNLNSDSIARAAREASAAAPAAADQFEQALWSTCSSMTRPRLDVLANRIDPKATWPDLVLPDEQTNLLHQIAHQVAKRYTVYEDWGFGARMNRGMGISALFAGESGTGKTMAAEVIANELRLNLYRIDLSAVVSKYIGETEKNLRRLFDAAEDGGAILFFDEADALFGKRSEVKDSHDRYANIEINYLLQRMEQYRGLAILATNMKSALDQAFMRRLRFIVNFPVPSPAERKLIWQKVFPAQLPKAVLDYDRLARFSLTGGNIHSIALNAAFLAAQDQTPVTMPLALRAMRAEFRKLERPINEAEFRI